MHTTLTNSQRGFTLLENMVALLILSIGLLGIAGLQAFTLKSGASSAMRLSAIQQANEMADRMRANIGGIYPPPGGATLYSDVTPMTPPAAGVNCLSAMCTPGQLEAYDLLQWYTDNLVVLPGPTGYAGGYITRTDMVDNGGNTIRLYPGTLGTPGPARARFTITMRWDGERTGATGLNCPPQSNTDLNCYIMEVDL